MTEWSQKILFIMLDPQKDNARREYVSVSEETIPHVQGPATNDAQSFWDITTVQSRGLQQATKRSLGITANRIDLVTTNVQKKKDCTIHLENGILLSSASSFRALWEQ